MRILKAMAIAASLATPGLMMAGNVPQYTIGRVYTTGEDAPLGEGWDFFDDGTVISTANRQNFEPSVFIFADGTESVNGYRGPGFPIGFDFRIGGHIVDQFAVSSNAMIQLGKGEVDYRGNNIALIARPEGEMYTYESPFQIDMAPIMAGATKGTISYKTIGDEGKRICIVQWRSMLINEISATVDRQKARFSLQMRLYEEDGRVEMAFLGEQSPRSSNGFYTGIHGWDNNDQLIVASDPREGQEYGITNRLVAKDLYNVNMLEKDTYIVWSPEDDDDESFVLTFYPPSDTPAPSAAPVDLKAMQTSDYITVTGKKAEGADATLIVYSNSPFTDADLPADGTSYRVYSNNGEFASIIGNSTVIYYRNEDEFEVTIPEVEPDNTFYIRAYSVNGYPNYNKENVAETSVVTTQLPPTGFFSETREDGANLHWTSDFPVIVAVTTEIPRQYFESYQGVFGQPAADVEVGDEIPGGGKVIYVGDASECFVDNSMLKPNFPNMFRIWNVKEDVVSSTANNTYAIPEITLPYQPEVETWPYALLPVGFETSDETNGWTPRFRDYDSAQSLNGLFASSSKAGYPVSLTLTTPEIPFVKGPVKLEFEWALETERDPAPADPSNPNSPLLPRGREPGWFGEVPGGDPGLHIACGPKGMTKVVETIDKYDGTMVAFQDEGYYDGSAEWMPVSVELGDLSGMNVISFTGSCEKNTLIYLRKISVTQTTGVDEIAPASAGLTVTAISGGISVKAENACDVDIYNILGVRVASLSLSEGETAEAQLPSGVYVAGGVKVVVR
ncbi:MAG: hypothetical protein HDS82_02920 [Bacteroidales bacterium]|nr:hypothetical protein [Bacteroidales bacterium]